MTEAEWRACTDLKLMLKSLRNEASERKLRLFACACCRHFWELLIDERSRAAVDVAERFSDGLIASEEVRAALVSAMEATVAVRGSRSARTEPAARLRCQHSPEMLWRAAATAAFAASGDAAHVNAHVHGNEGLLVPYREQARLLRDIFGPLPFRPVSLRSQHLTPEIVALALSIYNDRAFDRLPRLADALEALGCEAGAILEHCRQPGTHVRGCWVVDFLLRKESTGRSWFP